jgi:hypothetical protein
MNMFGRNNENQQENEAPQRMEFPEPVIYEVLTSSGEWEKVVGHNCQVVEGHLIIMRGVFVNEECTQPGAVPAGFFAPGEWRRAKTDYQGFQRKSDLAIN